MTPDDQAERDRLLILIATAVDLLDLGNVPDARQTLVEALAPHEDTTALVELRRFLGRG